SYRAATLAERARPRIVSGPQSPWVRDACGSLSIRSTRRPAFASVPARWWQVEVLPTPPLALTRANVTAMPMAPPLRAASSRPGPVRSTVDHEARPRPGPPWTTQRKYRRGPPWTTLNPRRFPGSTIDRPGPRWTTAPVWPLHHLGSS